MRQAICNLLNRHGVNKGVPPNQIWYYAPEEVSLYTSAEVVRHSFSNGKGVLTFASPVTVVGQWLRSTAITDVKLPAAATSIGIGAFHGCSALAMTRLPDGITSIGAQAFANCINLALTGLPAGITVIADMAFYFCQKLPLTSLPGGIVSIGNQAFRNCYILALTHIPASVTTIAARAFNYCSAMNSLTFDGTPDNVAGDVFTGALENLYVPWAEGDVANAPWGATRATIHYNNV